MASITKLANNGRVRYRATVRCKGINTSKTFDQRMPAELWGRRTEEEARQSYDALLADIRERTGSLDAIAGMSPEQVRRAMAPVPAAVMTVTITGNDDAWKATVTTPNGASTATYPSVDVALAWVRGVLADNGV